MDKEYLDIESKIQQAASEAQYKVGFDEQAWAKMEELLDKDTDRKPIAYWKWLLPLALLLIGGFAIWYINKPGLPKADSASAYYEKINKIESSELSKNNKPGIVETKPNLNDTMANAIPAGSISKNFIVQDAGAQKPLKKYLAAKSYKKDNEHPLREARNNVEDSGKPFRATFLSDSKSENFNNEVAKKEKVVNEIKPEPVKPVDKIYEANDSAALEKAIIKNNKPVENETVKSPLVIKNSKTPLPKNTVDKPQEQRKNFGSKIFIKSLIGVGADVVNFKVGTAKFTPKYGIGIGYQTGNASDISIGFISHRKKYEAGPGDYTIKPGYWSQFYIKGVDADCKVYEIPLSFSFAMPSKHKIKPYGEVGILSFLMKNEYYDYEYIRNGQPARWDDTYTGNKHFAASIFVSGGVSYALSNRVGLSVGPAIAVPVYGIGDGKVNLYSLQLMSGIKYFPFRKK